MLSMRRCWQQFLCSYHKQYLSLITSSVITGDFVRTLMCITTTLLLHSFNGLFFQDNLGKPAPEKLNHYGKTNLHLLEQETVIGSGISWAICKSAPRLRQITIPAPRPSIFYRPDALPATQPTASKQGRQTVYQ